MAGSFDIGKHIDEALNSLVPKLDEIIARAEDTENSFDDLGRSYEGLLKKFEKGNKIKIEFDTNQVSSDLNKLATKVANDLNKQLSKTTIDLSKVRVDGWKASNLLDNFKNALDVSGSERDIRNVIEEYSRLSSELKTAIASVDPDVFRKKVAKMNLSEEDLGKVNFEGLVSSIKDGTLKVQDALNVLKLNLKNISKDTWGEFTKTFADFSKGEIDINQLFKFDTSKLDTKQLKSFVSDINKLKESFSEKSAEYDALDRYSQFLTNMPKTGAGNLSGVSKQLATITTELQKISSTITQENLDGKFNPLLEAINKVNAALEVTQQNIKEVGEIASHIDLKAVINTGGSGSSAAGKAQYQKQLNTNYLRAGKEAYNELFDQLAENFYRNPETLLGDIAKNGYEGNSDKLRNAVDNALGNSKASVSEKIYDLQQLLALLKEIAGAWNFDTGAWEQEYESKFIAAGKSLESFLSKEADAQDATQNLFNVMNSGTKEIAGGDFGALKQSLDQIYELLAGINSSQALNGESDQIAGIKPAFEGLVSVIQQKNAELEKEGVLTSQLAQAEPADIAVIAEAFNGLLAKINEVNKKLLAISIPEVATKVSIDDSGVAETIQKVLDELNKLPAEKEIRITGLDAMFGVASDVEGATASVKDFTEALNVIADLGGAETSYKKFFSDIISGFTNLVNHPDLKKALETLSFFKDGKVNMAVSEEGTVNRGVAIGDDYVLRAAGRNESYNKHEYMAEQMDALAEKGVRLGRILGLVRDSEGSFIELQEKVAGSKAWGIEGSEANLKILEATDEQIRKLVQDLKLIDQAGMGVDALGANLFYDKTKGFSFIDLSEDGPLHPFTSFALENNPYGVLKNFELAMSNAGISSDDPAYRNFIDVFKAEVDRLENVDYSRTPQEIASILNVGKDTSVGKVEVKVVPNTDGFIESVQNEVSKGAPVKVDVVANVKSDETGESISQPVVETQEVKSEVAPVKLAFEGLELAQDTGFENVILESMQDRLDSSSVDFQRIFGDSLKVAIGELDKALSDGSTISGMAGAIDKITLYADALRQDLDFGFVDQKMLPEMEAALQDAQIQIEALKFKYADAVQYLRDNKLYIETLNYDDSELEELKRQYTSTVEILGKEIKVGDFDKSFVEEVGGAIQKEEDLAAAILNVANTINKAQASNDQIFEDQVDMSHAATLFDEESKDYKDLMQQVADLGIIYDANNGIIKEYEQRLAVLVQLLDVYKSKTAEVNQNPFVLNPTDGEKGWFDGLIERGLEFGKEIGRLKDETGELILPVTMTPEVSNINVDEQVSKVEEVKSKISEAASTPITIDASVSTEGTSVEADVAQQAAETFEEAAQAKEKFVEANAKVDASATNTAAGGLTQEVEGVEATAEAFNEATQAKNEYAQANSNENATTTEGLNTVAEGANAATEALNKTAEAENKVSDAGKASNWEVEDGIDIIVHSTNEAEDSFNRAAEAESNFEQAAQNVNTSSSDAVNALGQAANNAAEGLNNAAQSGAAYSQAEQNINSGAGAEGFNKTGDAAKNAAEQMNEARKAAEEAGYAINNVDYGQYNDTAGRGMHVVKQRGNAYQPEESWSYVVANEQSGQTRTVYNTWNPALGDIGGWDTTLGPMLSNFQAVEKQVESLDKQIIQLNSDLHNNNRADYGEYYDETALRNLIRAREEERDLLVEILGLYAQEQQYSYADQDYNNFAARRADWNEDYSNKAQNKQNVLDAKEQASLQREAEREAARLARQADQKSAFFTSQEATVNRATDQYTADDETKKLQVQDQLKDTLDKIKAIQEQQGQLTAQQRAEVQNLVKDYQTYLSLLSKGNTEAANQYQALVTQEQRVKAIREGYDKTYSEKPKAEVTDQEDLNELRAKEAEILAKIEKYKTDGVSKNDLTDLKALIDDYKRLAEIKERINNPTRRELGGEKVDIRIKDLAAQYDELIAKSEKYGKASEDITNRLKKAKDALTSGDKKDTVFEAGLDSFKNLRAELKSLKASAEDYQSVLGSTDKLQNLYDATNAEGKPKYTDELRASIKDILADINLLKTTEIDLNTEEGKQKVADLKAKIDEVFNNTSTNNRPQFAVALNSEIKTVGNSIASIGKAYDSMNSEQQAKFDQLQASWNAMVIDPLSYTQLQVRQLKGEVADFANTLKGAGVQAGSYFDAVGTSLASLGKSLGARYLSLYRVISYLKTAVTTVTELDKALTELRKVSDASTARLNQTLQTSTKNAKELGSTISDVISITSDWSRMGYSVDEAEELARVTTLFKNVGDNMTADSASSYMISTLKGFQMDVDESMRIADVYNEVICSLPSYAKSRNMDRMQIIDIIYSQIAGNPQSQLAVHGVEKQKKVIGWYMVRKSA